MKKPNSLAIQELHWLSEIHISTSATWNPAEAGGNGASNRWERTLTHVQWKPNTTTTVPRQRFTPASFCIPSCQMGRTPKSRSGMRSKVSTRNTRPKARCGLEYFAPAGEIVPAALKALRKGGTLALGGIHMSPIPPLDYNLLYQERVIRSVANNTRQDGRDFLRIAAEIPIHTLVQLFPLREANRALNQLKNDAINGEAVLIPPDS